VSQFGNSYEYVSGMPAQLLDSPECAVVMGDNVFNNNDRELRKTR
jgi:hypothetical protein